MSAEEDMWDARANLVLAGAETEEVDAYAHALAEMIRETAGNPRTDATPGTRLTYRWHARRNARLIDPEVN